MPAHDEQISEADLLAGVRRGDERAREELYRAYFARVFRWCRWMGGGRIDTEDAVAEVFVVAFSKIGGFRGDASLSTWLFRISRKVVASQRRRAWLGRLVGMEGYAGILAGPSDPGREAEARLLLDGAGRALDAMPAKKREAFILVDVCGYTLDEAAAALGTNAATIGTRVFYARRELLERCRDVTDEVEHDTR